MPIPEVPKTWPRECYGVAMARYPMTSNGMGITPSGFCNRVPSFQEALAQVEMAHMYALEQRQCQPPNGGGTNVRDQRAQRRKQTRQRSMELECSRTSSKLDLAPKTSSKLDLSPIFSSPLGKVEEVDTFISEKVLENWANLCWASLCLTDDAQKSVLNPVWCPSMRELVTFIGSSSQQMGSQEIEIAAKESYSLASRSQSVMGLDSPRNDDDNDTPRSPNSQLHIARFSTIKSRTGGLNRSRPKFPALHPTGKTRLTWDVFGLLLCMYEVIALPMVLAQLFENPKSFAAFSCIYWTLDLGMAFATGHFSKDGIVVLRFRRIAMRYLKSWLLFDVTLTVVDWFTLLFGGIGFSSRSMTSVIRLVRIARLLRIIKLAPNVQNQLGRVNSQFVFSLLRLSSYIAMVVLFNHYIACLWCATWSDSNRFLGDLDNNMYRFFTGLHWSFAHCLLGSMDIYPTDAFERVFSCLLLVISLVVFSTLLSMITNDALLLRAVYEDRNRKNQILLSFLSEHRFQSDIVCMVWHYVRQNNLLDHTVTKPETAKHALAMFPSHVQQEIQYSWFKPLLLKHPFFVVYEQLEPAAVRMMCNIAVTDLSLLPEEQMNHQMWSKVMEAEQMIFVEKGELEYHPWDHHYCKNADSDTVVSNSRRWCGCLFKGQGARRSSRASRASRQKDEDSLDIAIEDKHVVVIEPGMWACEEALWSTSARIFGILQAGEKVCDLLLLSVSEFKEIAVLYPTSLNFVMRYAREFVAAFNDACTNFKEEEVLFNSPRTMQHVVDAAQKTGWTHRASFEGSMTSISTYP